MDRATELKISSQVFYPEGMFRPEMNRSVRAPPTAATSASGWSIVRGRTSKADRAAKARSMVLTNFA